MYRATNPRFAIDQQPDTQAQTFIGARYDL